MKEIDMEINKRDKALNKIGLRWMIRRAFLVTRRFWMIGFIFPNLLEKPTYQRIDERLLKTKPKYSRACCSTTGGRMETIIVHSTFIVYKLFGI